MRQAEKDSNANEETLHEMLIGIEKLFRWRKLLIYCSIHHGLKIANAQKKTKNMRK